MKARDTILYHQSLQLLHAFYIGGTAGADEQVCTVLTGNLYSNLKPLTQLWHHMQA